LPEVHKLSMQDKIAWRDNNNKRDNRRATFRYMFYKDIPDSCLVAKWPIEYTAPLPFEP